MDSPKVSVICFVFNHEKYLRQALEGFVMQQTNFPFEVIIHDDASTDSSVSIIEEYKTNYPAIFKPIYQKINQHSIEKGRVTKIAFAAAQGQYIALCEGDDFWSDELKLQKQLSFLEQNANYSSVFSEVNLVDGDSNFIKVSNRVLHGITTLQYQDLIIQNVIHTCSFVFRRDALGADFNEIINKMKVGDVPLFLYCSLNGPIHYFKEAMAAYRTNVGIMRAKFNSASIITTKIEIIWYFKRNVTKNKKLKKFEYYGLMMNYHKLLRLRVRSKEYSKALVVYLHIICAYLGFLFNKNELKTYHLFDVRRLAFPFLKQERVNNTK